VIDRRNRFVTAAHTQTTTTETVERLRRGNLVDEVQIDIEHGRCIRLLRDDV
jgi:hypothetical protein